MRLGDVAKVVEQHQLLIGDALVNDKSGLLLVVEKFPWANTLDVTRGVDEALKSLRPGFPGIEFDAQIFRPASFVEQAMANLGRPVLLGAVLLVLVTGLLLLDWRGMLVALVAVPLSFAASGLVLHLLGETINFMVLAGLAVALIAIVDDAVVGADSVMRRQLPQAAPETAASRTSLVVETLLEMRRSAVFATLIVALTVVPLLTATGILATFLKPIAAASLLALLASLLVGMTVTPVLAVLLRQDGGQQPAERPIIARLQRWHATVLTPVLASPRTTLAACALAAVAGWTAWSMLGRSLLPSFKEQDVVLSLATAPGTSLPETRRIVGRVADELRGVSGVRGVSAHVGRAVTGDQVVGVNAAKLWLNLDARADHATTLAAVGEIAGGYPGISMNVQTYLKERMSEVVRGAGRPIVVRVIGAEQQTLTAKAEDVRQAMSKVYGVVNARIEGQLEEPQVHVRVDLAAAGRAGLKPGDIRRSASTVFAGLEVGKIFEQQKIFDVMVWSPPEQRQSLTAIRETSVETPRGGHVRIGDVADVGIKPAPVVVQREDVSRYIDVVADVRGRDIGSAIAEVAQRLQDVKFPLEYHAELLGEHTELQTQQKRLLAVSIMSAIGILLLLQAAFRNWRLAAAALLLLPVGIVGGVVATLGIGAVSIGTLAGLLAALVFMTRGTSCWCITSNTSSSMSAWSWDPSSCAAARASASCPRSQRHSAQRPPCCRSST